MASEASGQIEQAQELDLQALVGPLVRHWRRFLLLWVGIGLVLGVVSLHLTPRFTSHGSLYLDSAMTGFGGGDPTGLASLLGGESDTLSQQGLLRSAPLLLGAITQAGLNAELSGPEAYLPEAPFYWQYRLNRDPSRFMRGLVVVSSALGEGRFTPVNYAIVFGGDGAFEVVKAQRVVGRGLVGEPVVMGEARFTLRLVDGPLPEAGSRFELVIRPAQRILEDFAGDLAVHADTHFTLQSKMISLGVTADSPLKAKLAVEALIDDYGQLKQGWATELSSKILAFATDQLDVMRAQVTEAESRLADYQESSGVIALEPQLKAQIESLVELEIELRHQRLRQFELAQLAGSLKSGNPDLFLTGFVEDPMLQKMGGRLSELNSHISALRSEFRADYPPLQKAISMRGALLKDIEATLSNYVERAGMRIGELQQQMDTYRSEFEQMPGKARAWVDFERTTQVFEKLYARMVELRHEAALKEASSLTNLREVGDPLIPIKESSPKLKMLVVVVGALSFFLAAAAVVVPALRVRWFEDLEQVRASFSQSVFAVVPHRGASPKRGSTRIIEAQLQSPFAEAIRLLRTNLLHTAVGREHQTVMVCSAMPEDGKTSITANLAATLARSSRVNRVLLIDADMHHPSLHEVFALSQEPGLSGMLNGLAGVDEAIRTVTLEGGQAVDVLTAGAVPPSPVELIDTEVMRQLLRDMRDRYDFVVIDTPPYPMTTTASVLAPSVDRVLSVCRIGKTDRTLFAEHVRDLSTLNKFLGLVVNVGRRQRVGYGQYGKNVAKRGGWFSGGGSNGNGNGNGHGGSGVNGGGRSTRLESKGEAAGKS